MFQSSDFAEVAAKMRATINDDAQFRAVMSNNFNVILAALDHAALPMQEPVADIRQAIVAEIRKFEFGSAIPEYLADAILAILAATPAASIAPPIETRNDEAGFVEFVNSDVPYVVQEIDGPVAIIRDMETRQVIGYRVYDPASVAPAVTELRIENQHLRKLIAGTHRNGVKHTNCEIDGNCPICDGGLFVCADCGAAEIETEERICSALTSSTASGEDGWRAIPIDVETVNYVLRYGGMCRECADANGICPNNGLPCEVPAAIKAAEHVIRALNYGFSHGFLPSSSKEDGNAR